MAAVAFVVGGLAVLATEWFLGGRIPDCDAGRVRDALVDLARTERDLAVREVVGIETLSRSDGETLCRARLLHGEGDARIAYHVDRQDGRPVVRITEWQPP